MVRSMTGYGKAEVVLDGGKLIVEIRSLNGKNADISLKTSVIPKDKEMYLRKKIADSLQRGTIDVFVSHEPDGAEIAKKINRDIALEYFSQVQELGSSIGLGDIRADNPNALLSLLLRMPDVMDVSKKNVVTEDNWPVVESAFDAAIESLSDFRTREGAVLRADVTSKVEKILSFSKAIEQYEAERTASVKERILSRFAELKVEPDPARLEQEMIFYIEKLDINEERVRLRQHCAYFLETLDSEPYPGRKLGFIAQEMGREINTTGSKANHPLIQRLVTDMKDELEKIKEQSLNIL